MDDFQERIFLTNLNHQFERELVFRRLARARLDGSILYRNDNVRGVLDITCVECLHPVFPTDCQKSDRECIYTTLCEDTYKHWLDFKGSVVSREEREVKVRKIREYCRKELKHTILDVERYAAAFIDPRGPDQYYVPSTPLGCPSITWRLGVHVSFMNSCYFFKLAEHGSGEL